MPFEEDPKDSSIWFLDHNFHEQMHAMFKKVNGTRDINNKLAVLRTRVSFSPVACVCFLARENVVGWYSTGPKVRASDLEINELMRKYTPNPVLVIIDPTDTATLGLPTKAYISVEEVSEVRRSVLLAVSFFVTRSQRSLCSS